MSDLLIEYESKSSKPDPVPEPVELLKFLVEENVSGRIFPFLVLHIVGATIFTPKPYRLTRIAGASDPKPDLTGRHSLRANCVIKQERTST